MLNYAGGDHRPYGNFGGIKLGRTQGAERAAEEFGLDLEKEWLATPGGRKRDTHAAANGQRRGLEETFTVGGQAARYPGDPSLSAAERVKCRCAVAYVPAEAKALGWRDDRDARIKARYRTLLPQMGQVQAMAELADEESLSESQVRRIIYRGQRA